MFILDVNRKSVDFVAISVFCRQVNWSRKTHYDKKAWGLTPRETRIGTGNPRISAAAVAEWRTAMEDPDSPEAEALRDWHDRQRNPVGPEAKALAARREVVRLKKVAAATSKARTAA